uniref:Uncharacterized protein n=1 Tax=Anguilla anguilla TaxID=7936 RepID=A0A0E9STS5_ANGAN
MFCKLFSCILLFSGLVISGPIIEFGYCNTRCWTVTISNCSFSPLIRLLLY